VFFIATFALIFVMRAVARKPGVNVLVFYLFSLAEGGMLGPYLGHFANHIPNGGNLIWEAFLLTSVTVAGVGGYAYMSGKDFGFLGRFLFWALIGLIIVGFASWFVLALDTSVMVLGYETIFVAVFVGFLLYDFSNIRLRYSPEDYTMAAVQVYLDFINLFLAILRILSILQGGGVRRN
jgi:FtsH-binding integral membrane protein